MKSSAPKGRKGYERAIFALASVAQSDLVGLLATQRRIGTDGPFWFKKRPFAATDGNDFPKSGRSFRKAGTIGILQRRTFCLRAVSRQRAMRWRSAAPSGKEDPQHVPKIEG
jgi:hypothetical protein